MIRTYNKQAEYQKNVADHLMSLNWIPNHKWLETKVDNPNDGDLKRFMFGLWKDNYYLIHKHNKHTCTISKRKISFWELDPFYKLGDINLNKSTQLLENGLREVRTRRMFSTTFEINFDKMIQIKED